MIQDIIDWLVTYDEFNEIFDVSSDNASQVIDFLGTETISITNYIRIGYKRVLRDDYLLQVSKPFLKLLERKANTDFLIGLQKWVDNQNILGLVPKIGNHGKQRAWVDAQQFLTNNVEEEVAVYQVRLHIQYEVIS